MKILVFCAKGFETMEFSAFIDVFGWARMIMGILYRQRHAGLNRKVISTFGIPIIVDKTLDEINVEEYDALAIPGGFEEFGFYQEAFDERVMALIREFNAAGETYLFCLCWSAAAGEKRYIAREKGYHISSEKCLQTETIS